MDNGLSRRRQGFKSPWGRQQEITPLREIVRAFSLWGKSAPPSAPHILKKFCLCELSRNLRTVLGVFSYLAR